MSGRELLNPTMYHTHGSDVDSSAMFGPSSLWRFPCAIFCCNALCSSFSFGHICCFVLREAVALPVMKFLLLSDFPLSHELLVFLFPLHSRTKYFSRIFLFVSLYCVTGLVVVSGTSEFPALLVPSPGEFSMYLLWRLRFGLRNSWSIAMGSSAVICLASLLSELCTLHVRAAEGADWSNPIVKCVWLSKYRVFHDFRA